MKWKNISIVVIAITAAVWVFNRFGDDLFNTASQMLNASKKSTRLEQCIEKTLASGDVSHRDEAREKCENPETGPLIR